MDFCLSKLIMHVQGVSSGFQEDLEHWTIQVLIGTTGHLEQALSTDGLLSNY